MLSIEYITLIVAVITDGLLAESQYKFVHSLSVRDTEGFNWKRRRDRVSALWNVEEGKGGRSILGSERVMGVYLQRSDISL